MSEEIVLSAKHLKCAYPGQVGHALYIKEFQLVKGKVHFVLGRSGIGKSTLIESLGLMEKTVIRSTSSDVQLHSQGQSHDLISIWEARSDSISKFRQEHFSFIFQSTNLLPNLSLRENVLMPAWIEGRQSNAAQEAEIAALFGRLLKEIPEEDWDKDVTAISGGQRQRVAFMRALMTTFDVLFADEPTGNLDAYKATQAMDLLSSELKNKGGTACIVSHDIALALRYADIIYLLTPETGVESKKPYGALSKSNMFSKQDEVWLSGEGQRMEANELKERLNQALIES